MTQVQKIIKYLALAFAFFLIFSIIGGIMSFINIFNYKDNAVKELEELKVIENTSILDVEVKSANVIVKEGSVLKVETNNDNIRIKENSNKLFITEEKHNWFGTNNDTDLIIYVPSNFIFDGVSIESGAGKIEIDSLSTRELELDLGAGKVRINNLVVLNNASVDGGAGKIEILNGQIHNLELDMGVGELSFNAELIGNSEIDAGVGKVNLNLIGDNYKILVDKGLGTTTINGENISDKVYGEGENLIDIDGGVGSIEIIYGI